MKGFPVQHATFGRLTDARKWAQNTESAIREGRYFKTTEAKHRTLNDLLDRYINDVLPNKPKNSKITLRHLNWWKEELFLYTDSKNTFYHFPMEQKMKLFLLGAD